MSQSNWRIFKTFSPRHMATFDWPKCLDFQGDTCQQLIGKLESIISSHLFPIVCSFTSFLCQQFSKASESSLLQIVTTYPMLIYLQLLVVIQFEDRLLFNPPTKHTFIIRSDNSNSPSLTMMYYIYRHQPHQLALFIVSCSIKV